MNKKAKGILISFISIFFIYITVFDSHGLISLYQKQAQKESITQRLKKDSLEIMQLKKYDKDLKHNDTVIQKVAREKYNLKHENETVYRINILKNDTN